MDFKSSLKLRPAETRDVNGICRMLNGFAGKRLLLPRTPDDILARIGNFHVAEVDGAFAGCIALRDFGAGLFEIRSLAVEESFQGSGIGSAMVSAVLESMRSKAPCRIFALTYRVHFFVRLGFNIVEKDLFPEKIWSDCSICPNKENCDETAVMLDIR